MSYIKKNKNSKWYFLVSFLSIFVATAFIFSSSVFSSSEINMKIEYDGDSWDVSGESPDWTSTGKDVAFKVDLSNYYKELPKEDGEGSTIPYNRPFNVESHDPNPTFTKGKDESGNFNGVYHVTVDNLSEDGELEINVVFTEDNGWEIPSSENVEFSILKDTISPNIKYNGPDNGEVIHKGNVNLHVDIEEENLTTKNITITRNGEEIHPQVNWNKNRASINIEDDGKYHISTTAEDKAGNTTEEALTFFVHKGDPTWQITSGDNGVEDGAALNNSTVTLGVQNGIDIASATVEVKKGHAIVDEVELTVDGQSATAEYEFEEDGEYTLEGTLQDAKGEETHQLNSFNVVIDKTNPDVTVSDEDTVISDGDAIYEDSFTLSVKAEEVNLNLDESSVFITHNSFDNEESTEEISLSYDGKEAKGFYYVEDAGEYEVSGTIVDQAGNTTDIEQTFTLYMNSDLISIKANNDSLQDYYINDVLMDIRYWDFRPLEKSFTVTKYNLVEGKEEPYLDSSKLDHFGFINWITHNFVEGQYNLTIETQNISGDTEKINRTFIVDKTDPEVVLEGTSLHEGEHVTSAFVTEQGGISELFDISASDDYLHEKSVEVQYQDAKGKQRSWINADAGKWVETEGAHHFTLKEELFDSEGQYTINVHASDKAGRSTTKEFSFTIDDTAPVIELTEVDRYSNKIVDQEVVVTENNYEQNNVTIEIKKQNEDGEFEDIRDNFDEWENEGIASVGLFRFKEDGTYKMSVEASDAAGNEAKSASSTFTIDTNHPNTVISGVEDKDHYNENKTVEMQVKDRNIDESNTSVEVNKWSEDTGQFEAMDIDTSLIFENNQANWKYDFEEEGKYELILNATDKAGHQAESQHIIFTIDKTNPEALIDSLTNGEFYATEQQVNFQVNELNYRENNVQFKVVKDGQDITENVEGNANWRNESTASTFTYTFDQDGDYEITLSSEDKAGNKSKVMNKNFTIDLTNPTIKVDGVKDTIHYDNKRKVSIDIADTNITSYDLLITNNKDEDFKYEKSGEENFSGELTFEEEGDYVIDISAIDDAGNQSSKVVEFTIDKTDPVISIDNQMPKFTTFENIKDKGINDLLPIMLTEENMENKEVTIQVTDNKGNTESYNEKDTGKWESLDGENYQYVLTEDFFKADGDYKIVVKAEDEAGRKDQANLSFTVDNIKPKIDLTDIATFNKKEKTASVKIREHNYHNNDVSIDVYREKGNGDYSKITNQFSKWKNTKEVASLDFPFTKDGKYRIVVNATDAAGNKAVTQQDTFTIDTVNPDISISGVKNDTHYNNSKKVTVSVDDANVSKSDTNLSVLKLNHSTGKMQPYKTGKAPNFSRRAMDWQYTFSTSDEGTYRVQIGATDLAGNKGSSQSVDFTIDKTAPALSINDVTDGKYYNSGQNAEFTVRETNHASNSVQFAVTKDGQDMTSRVEGTRGSSWRTAGTLSRLSYGFLEDGAYTATLNATDEAGNKSKTAQKSFVIDTVDPAIEIAGVEDGEHYNEDVPVDVTITDVNFDQNNIRVTRNGANYPVGGFSITNNGYQNSIASFSHRFSQEGEYEIFVESTDKAKNHQTESIAFTIDKTAPVITPLMDGDNEELIDGAYINYVFQPIFRLDNEEDTIVSIHLNGGSNMAGNVPAASKEMEYNYEVLARDEAGNETTLNIGFTLDTTRPELNISGIIEGFFNNDIRPHVDYSDKHLDEERTSVTLNGAPFANGTQLTREQDYILEAVITDLADNVSERTIVFTIDKTAPMIRFKEAISGKYLNEVLIPELLIEDMTGYDIIALTLNGEPYELGDPIETEGKHVLYFEVKDQAGNIQQLTAEFIIDLTPPVVIFEGADEQEEYVEAIDLAISLENAEDRIKQVTVNGEIYEDLNIENNGFTLHFTDIDEYNVEVTADDQAGNEVTESLTFAITEKGLLTQFYENKPLFSFSIAGVLGVLLAIFIVALRLRKKSVEE